MKKHTSYSYKTGWSAIMIYIATAVASSAAPAPNVPLPIPNSNVQVMAFQERKEMFPETAAHHTETINKVLKAIAYSDRSAFLFRGTTQFQKADPKDFELLVSKWADRIKDGFRTNPIGELRRGHATSLWRVQFTSGGDEALIVFETDKRGNIVTFHFM
jgi:hypothetical protein